MNAVPRVLPHAVPVALTALLLVLGGCGSDDPTTSADHAIGQRHHRAQPATPQPSEPPAQGTGGGKGGVSKPQGNGQGKGGGKVASLFSPGDPRPTTMGAHLLTVRAMPVVSKGSWRIVRNGAEDQRAVGACQKTSLETIGAVSAVRRDYDGGGTLRATQVVARFADKVSAARAHGVLTAWRNDCEQRLDFPTTKVGPIVRVATHRGLGEAYRSAFGPKSGRGLASGFGMVWKGRFLSIIEISADTTTYPADWDPARAAVRRISRTFA